MPRARSWTDEQLAEAVACSFTMAEVMRELGLKPGSYELMWRHIRRTDIDATHVRDRASSPSVTDAGGARHGRWTDHDLTEAVASAVSYADVMRSLGYEPNGGVHRFIKAHIARLGLDTSHFVGQSWAKGRTFPYRPQRSLDELLVENSTMGSSTLRQRLIKAGLKEARCECCGLDSWLGEALPLALDHVNGDPTDNRLENLRILCPNCHALTPTWCARNRGRGIVQGEKPA